MTGNLGATTVGIPKRATEGKAKVEVEVEVKGEVEKRSGIASQLQAVSRLP